MEHFSSLNAPGGGASDDPDNDNFTNLREQQAGLDPLAFDGLRFQHCAPLPDGTFQLTVFGPPGIAFALMTTTDLASWTPLLNFTCTNLPTVLRDSASTNFDHRFYRVVSAQQSP